MNLVWATRGRAWGFRFLLDGGFGDPFPVYDSAFSGTEGESAVYRRIASRVALRFPDPLGRRDEAGRVIPHDLVVLPPLADEVRSVEEGLLVVWPLIADFYADVWDQPQPPSGPSVRAALGLKVDPDAIRGPSVRAVGQVEDLGGLHSRRPSVAVENVACPGTATSELLVIGNLLRCERADHEDRLGEASSFNDRRAEPGCHPFAPRRRPASANVAGSRRARAPELLSPML